jgi:hypothetical protein
MGEITKNTADENLDALRQALASDPTNLHVARRYWQALGNYKGSDVRSGRDVIQAYRSAALSSHQGAVALAQAYKELFETSGEPPRALYFDKDLMHALESWYETSTSNEGSMIGWLLEKIGH